MSQLLHAAQRGVAKRMGEIRHQQCQNQLLLISGEAVTIRDICSRSGLTSDVVRKRFRRGKREWADFGVTKEAAP